VSEHCKKLESMNIPAVGAAAANIVKFAIGYNFEYTNGMPVRYVGFPFPVAGQPKEVHHKYVFESNDVVSGKPMMKAILDAFTSPLTEAEKYSGPAKESVEEPRLLPPGTEDALQQLFKDKDWTDYNPIILPTEERVAAMLKGTSKSPTTVVKDLAIRVGRASLRLRKSLYALSWPEPNQNISL
jgi:hypothetical protein